MSYIKINNLSYSYGVDNKKSLENINLSIEKGEILLVLGKSGCGKSTLLKCISGAIPHFYGGTLWGNVTIKDEDLRFLPHKDRAKEIMMVFQDPERQLMMNKVHREVAFGLENIGVNSDHIKRRVFEALQFVNILDLSYRDVTTLSGGEKQKVNIASAVSYQPNCILLDEPTSQLDPTSSLEIVDLVKRINEELFTTIVIVEQRIDKWFDVADKILILDGGKVAFYGDKDMLYESQKESLNRYLPTYLSISKALKVKKRPENIKKAKVMINKLFKDIKKDQILSSNNKEEPLIKIKNLSVSYKDKEALKDINIQIKKGEIIGVIGANGSGKSTLLKTITGLIDYKGSIKIKEQEVKKRKLNELSRDIAYLSQNPNDYLTKDTVYEEIKFTLDNFNIKDTHIIDSILNQLEIGHLKNKNPKDLSGGERQRVAIASILVTGSQVILLDEPTRGIDVESKERLENLLKKLNDKGKTIILITHDMDFAATLCDRLMMLFNGEMVALGNEEEVFSNGIYYTTAVNKLFRDRAENFYTLKQVIERIKK